MAAAGPSWGWSDARSVTPYHAHAAGGVPPLPSRGAASAAALPPSFEDFGSLLLPCLEPGGEAPLLGAPARGPGAAAPASAPGEDASEDDLAPSEHEPCSRASDGWRCLHPGHPATCERCVRARPGTACHNPKSAPSH